MSNNQVNTPIQNLNVTYFNSPTGNNDTQIQDTRPYHTSFLNVCGGSLDPNATNATGNARFMGSSSSQIMSSGTSYFTGQSSTPQPNNSNQQLVKLAHQHNYLLAIPEDLNEFYLLLMV